MKLRVKQVKNIEPLFHKKRSDWIKFRRELARFPMWGIIAIALVSSITPAFYLTISYLDYKNSPYFNAYVGIQKNCREEVPQIISTKIVSSSRTTANYDLDTKKIWIDLNRKPVEIRSSIRHELCHLQQDKEGRFKKPLCDHWFSFYLLEVECYKAGKAE